MGEIPDVAAVLAPILGRVEPDERPLLLAIAERMAAERYRQWAASADTGYDRDRLLACADREEEIATRVESLRRDAQQVQDRIHRKLPDLAALTHTLFDGRPWREQFTMQARGERLGAANWRAFAKLYEDPAAKETLLECARLEEASADVLESILSEHGAG